MKKIQFILAVSIASLSMVAQAYEYESSSTSGSKDVYANFPITLNSYKGDKKTSLSYTGQIARHVLHDSLKKLVAKTDGANSEEIKAKMMAYLVGKDAGRVIIAPKTKGAFVVKQATIDEISKGKNLSSKAYKGGIAGWPGNMTGPEVLAFMVDKASKTTGGYDPLTGYDYTQLISKFAMGAIFYNQAVDNYLDELLEADKKPNNQAYKAGAPYTGKEHVWDEAFGYFGAPAHTLSLTAKDVHGISKQKDAAFTKADANGDGVVDLTTEMAFAHAYYAAVADRSGKTDYLRTITQAFYDGRMLIKKAKGNALSDKQRATLKGYASIIAENWEKVIAEAVFNYAGKTYKDIQKLDATVKNNGDASAIFRKYAKHWGELKGFSLALQTGKNNLGETAVKLNRLIGFSPVLLGNTQVASIDASGNYTQASSESLEEYKLHMLKVQKLMVDAFGVKARAQDALSGLGALADKLGSGTSAEND